MAAAQNFACIDEYPGAMDCDTVSIYDPKTQTEEPGSIPKTCKPNHEPISKNWDCTICQPGFTKNKKSGRCESHYQKISGKNCSKIGKEDYKSHNSKLSNVDCLKICEKDDTCLAYAWKKNEFCSTYSKCSFKQGTTWGGEFFQHKSRAYAPISGKHCSKAVKEDYTAHGKLSSEECQKKCDEDDTCIVYYSKNREQCNTYNTCSFKQGTTWGGNFFQHKSRHEDFVLLAQEKAEKERLAQEKAEKERLAQEKAEKERLTQEKERAGRKRAARTGKGRTNNER